MPATSVFAHLEGHEQVIFGSDPETGLRAIIGLHSTALGPGLGGTRFYPYPDEAAALTDVLHLSRAMSYKNALAGLEHGGGKAVIIGDPGIDKTADLLRAYGRLVDSLAGRYVTACDVGTYVEDMDVVAEVTRFVTGRSTSHGGSGDSSVLTAFGVLQGMKACAQQQWGSASLADRRVAISGVGKVGHRLVEHVLDEGARVIIFDVNQDAVAKVVAAHPDVEVAESEVELSAAAVDVYSPNALGGALNQETIGRLQATVVCGGANNQLASPDMGRLLADSGICYAPDYLVNAGGVIQVADELHGFDFDRAKARAATIFQTTHEVLGIADQEQLRPEQAADQLAERRMAQLG